MLGFLFYTLCQHYVYNVFLLPLSGRKKSIIAAITIIWAQIELAGYNWLKNQNIVTFMAQIIYNKCQDYSVLILWEHINRIIEFRKQHSRIWQHIRRWTWLCAVPWGDIYGIDLFKQEEEEKTCRKIHHKRKKILPVCVIDNSSYVHMHTNGNLIGENIFLFAVLDQISQNSFWSRVPV